MALSIPKKRCRKCGLPWFVYSAFRWNENGTITANPWPWGSNFRSMVLPISTVRGLFDHFEQSLEFPVEQIVFEAQKHAGIAVYQAFYDKVPGLKALARRKFMRRFIAGTLNEMAGWLGMADSETLDYIPGEVAITLFRNVCDLTLVSAIVSGVFDLVEFQHLNIDWEKTGEDEYRVRAEVTGEQSEQSEQMAFAEIESSIWFPSIFKRSLAVVPGSIEHHRCPKCSAPTGLSRLEWKGEGIIIDNVTGFRVVFLDGYTITTVTNELAKRIGSGGLETMVDIVRKYTRDHPEAFGMKTTGSMHNEGQVMTSLVEYLNVFPLFGYGNPVSFEVDGLELKAVIDNPFDVCIVAGTLQGLYETIINADSIATWQNLSDIRVSCTIEPA